MLEHTFVDFHLLKLLEEYEQSGYPPVDLLASRYFRANRALGASDRRQIASGFFGIIRWAGTLEALSAHGSWSEMIALWKEGSWLDELGRLAPYLRCGFPRELYELLVDQYGEEAAQKLCVVSNEEAPCCVRVNSLKIQREELQELWKGRFSTQFTEHASSGLVLSKREPLLATEEFRKGFFEVQDEGSQLVAEQVAIRPGQLLLDYCAGSGGKSLAVAPRMEGKGQLFLYDVRSSQLLQAKTRLSRASVQNSQCLLGAGAMLQLNKLKKRCDWVLVDVPCSGTGTLRRHPDMKWRCDRSFVMGVVGQQRSIFEKALSYLHPGGTIVYATCSILEQENQRQIDHFIATYELELDGEPLCTLPISSGMDGFFAARLRRRVK